MLDMGVYNLLSMQSFHGVWAGNVQECLLKSHIGKASIMVLLNLIMSLKILIWSH
jgi:hypothetical protein